MQVGYYDSLKVEAIIIIFMFIGGINFTLIWFLIAREFIKAFADEEFKTYLVYIFICGAIYDGSINFDKYITWRFVCDIVCFKQYQLVHPQDTPHKTT